MASFKNPTKRLMEFLPLILAFVILVYFIIKLL
jgi:hypothetical protein